MASALTCRVRASERVGNNGNTQKILGSLLITRTPKYGTPVAPIFGNAHMSRISEAGAALDVGDVQRPR